eukprot:6798210-Prymnesium_polylepis.1
MVNTTKNAMKTKTMTIETTTSVSTESKPNTWAVKSISSASSSDKKRRVIIRMNKMMTNET